MQDSDVVYVATAIIVDEQRRILCQTRNVERDFPGRVELPGGKLEPGETWREALARELLEELAVEVEVDDLPLFSVWAGPPDFDVDLDIAFFRATIVNGTPTPNPSVASSVLWLDYEDMLSRDTLPGIRNAARHIRKYMEGL